jgi:hypothetical protein
VEGAERIVHVRVDELGHLPGEPSVVLLLARVEAEVLQDRDVAGTEPPDRVHRLGIGRRAEPRDDPRAPELAPEGLDDGGHPELLLDGPLGPAEVGGDHHGRAAVEQLAERGQRGADPRVVAHACAVERDVQIRAEEDAAALGLAEILEGRERHRDRATISTRSTSRLEYPHSLSYQPSTFTTLAIAIVASESNVQEAGEPTMSVETIGSVA